MRYFDDAPVLLYKLQEVKEALSQIDERIKVKANEFMIDDENGEEG